MPLASLQESICLSALTPPDLSTPSGLMRANEAMSDMSGGDFLDLVLTVPDNDVDADDDDTEADAADATDADADEAMTVKCEPHSTVLNGASSYSPVVQSSLMSRAREISGRGSRGV